MRGLTMTELPDDAVRVTDGIYAVAGHDLDWRVYEETDRGWRLINVKPTLRSVRQQYDPEIEENPPPVYRAISVDRSGHRHQLGAGPLAAMRETAMATWLAEPGARSAYVLDPRGNAFLTLEPRDRSRLMSANPIPPAMYAEWNRVNYAQRMAEKSGDYEAVSRAKAEVRRVYAAMQEERANDRLRKNTVDHGQWTEIGRFDMVWRALNKMTEYQLRSAASTVGRIEMVPSRSRPGKLSYAVFLKLVDGPKPPLDFLESQYVTAARVTKNRPHRRTSRRSKRTSRRAA